MSRSIKNNVINNVLPIDTPVHNWYRFVLSYPPHLVREYLQKFGADSTTKVLDPFCGTGTTVVECKKLGIDSVGLEANPMAFFASDTKVDWNVDAEKFKASCYYIANEAEMKTQEKGLRQYNDLPIFTQDLNKIDLLDLSEDQWKVLSRDFISPIPLHRTLVLLDVIRSEKPSRFRSHQEIALAKALVSGVGNIAFGPEIGATPPKADVDVVSIWLRECLNIYQDIQLMNAKPISATSKVHHEDSRSFALEDSSIDFVITSPPYPNEKDYTRTTRLESVILGFINNKKDLRRFKQGLLRSNTRNVYVTDDDERWISEVGSVKELATRIEERRKELGKTSGFEKLYHRVVELYFGGMARHLLAIKPSLKPGAKLAYVVGDQMSYFRIPIRTGTILAEVAENVGYRVEGIDLFRTRLATATKEWIREEVVILSVPS